MKLSRSTVSWVLVAIVAVTALAFGSVDQGGAQTNAERVYNLARTVQCPQCHGQSVAESDVGIAREIRADMARRVDAGETDDAIRQVYADRYGEWVLLTPSSSGFAGLVWVIPVIGGFVGLGVLVLAFLTWRRAEPIPATAADQAVVDAARD